MSKFRALPTDNSKTGASSDSIFYRPQLILEDQYKVERLEQQKKQQKLLSNINHPKGNGSRRRTLLKPVGRIALGGNRNKSGISATNKPTSHSQSSLLRNYKKTYSHSRTKFDNFKKDQLPPGSFKCSLFKKSLGCNRGYVGHFVGSKGPRYAKSRIRAIREDDLQTQLERIQYDKTLNAKRREELIAKLKFGLDDEDDRKQHKATREFWFHFEEGEPKKKSENTNNTNKENDKNDVEERRHWLGKPKQEDRNYQYVIFEWEGQTKNALVYPCTFIEFGLSTQLVADGSASAETAEKRHRQQLEKWRKKQAEKSMMEKLGNLFGHDDNGNMKGKKKKIRSDEMTPESKEKLREMYMDRIDLINEEWEMLKDLLGDDDFKKFKEDYEDHHQNKRNKKSDFGLVTGDDEDRSLIHDKVLSKRLKATKTRGQLEELGDFDEFMSDDEDETNLNNYDRIDDHEEDILTDDDGNESEKDESFKKLTKNLDEDITTKEYELPEKKLKQELENDSDVEQQEDDKLWNISDDDSDDDDDDLDDGVKIKRKKKTDPPNTNGNDGGDKDKKNSRKRKLDSKKDKNDSKKRKLNPEEEKKLKEELSHLTIKILKKHPDGIDMYELLGKIKASISADANALKAILAAVFKKLVRMREKNGKKVYILKKEHNK